MNAQQLISQMIESLGEDYESPKQIIDALNDGECLAKMGINDQALVEEATRLMKEELLIEAGLLFLNRHNAML